LDYISINKKAWDKRTHIHCESKFYDVKNFLEGKSSLNNIELVEVGSVTGKSLLHLQCHFGLDTLSWARAGAQVTGVDLSSDAIVKANELANKINIKANFICNDIYKFGERNKEKYDIVFISYGALCWLPDLKKWAEVIAKSLKVDGQVNLVEFHPFNDLLTGYSYFGSESPDVEEEITYTENCGEETQKVITWAHSISEVLNALIDVGICIESFNEHIYSPYKCLEGAEHVKNKGYQLLFSGQNVPVIYSIKGRMINK